MDCIKFQSWLTRRDIHETQIPPAAAGHLDGCSRCRQLLEADNQLENCIADAVDMEELPAGMVRRIDAAIDKRKQPRKTFLALASLTAGLILAFFFLPVLDTPAAFENLNQISQNAVASHLTGNREIRFDSSQTEQALELLTKELGFKVILPDPAQLNSTILGCRLCALGNCQAVYFAVERMGQPGSLFIMDTGRIKFAMTDGTRFSTRINGCDTRIWQANGQIYAMVF